MNLTEEQMDEIKFRSYQRDGDKNTLLQISSELNELSSELISIALELEGEYTTNNKRLIEKQNRAIEEYSDLQNMSGRLCTIMKKIEMTLKEDNNLEKSHTEWQEFKLLRRKEQLESKGIKFSF